MKGLDAITQGLVLVFSYCILERLSAESAAGVHQWLAAASIKVSFHAILVVV